MIWALLCIGIFLIVFNIRAIKKERGSFNYVFNETEENMEEFDFKLSELRREFSETILELQKEIEKLKGTYISDINNFHTDIDNIINENINKNSENTKEIQEDNEEYNKESLSEKEVRKENSKTSSKTQKNSKKQDKNDNSVKVDEISRLLNEGLSIDEISEKLGIGKGEVLLIKELYLR